jgi:hypothetical protein
LALPALVLLALLTAFLAWVSAEPFWLAVGHGSQGTAVVVAAQSGGEPACQATFTADGGDFIVSRVVLAGVRGSACVAGTRLTARMVSADGDRAYPVDHADLNLRWAVGFGLILLMGLLIMWITGALRFAGWRRVATTALSLGAPFLVTAGILTASF